MEIILVVHAQRMDDFAHSSSLKWRSLDDIQTLVLKGKDTNLQLIVCTCTCTYLMNTCMYSVLTKQNSMNN